MPPTPKAKWLLEDEDWKDCRRCGVRHKGKDFPRYHKAVDGRYGTCRFCRNAMKRACPSGQSEYKQAQRRRYPVQESHYNRFYKYGITSEEFEALVDRQEGRCVLCQKIPKKQLCVDHDHSTGAIRGLLCFGCNSGLGKLGDSIEGLERALNYLRGATT